MSNNSMRQTGLIACLLLAGLGVSACRQDMHDNPKYKPYRDGGMRQLPEGTVARGSLDLNPAAPKVGTATTPATQAAPAVAAPGQATTTPASAPVPTGVDGFPFKISEEILKRGESRYNISCLPCHGKLGDGTGMIVLRGFRKPPSYHEERLRKAPSSYFYDVISNGFGAMSSYSDQLTPEDRWKVIAYIRALQLSQRANVADLADNDKKELDNAERKAQEKTGGHSAAPAAAPAAGGHSN